MSHASRAVLRQAQACFQSELPAHVQPLAQPEPIGRAVELAFLRWEKRRLATTERSEEHTSELQSH